MASRFMIVNKSLDPLEFNSFTLNPGGSTVVEAREMHNDPAYPKYLALQKITLVEYVESGITKEMNGRGMIKRGVISSAVPAAENITTPEPSLTSKQEEEKAEEEPPAPVVPVEEEPAPIPPKEDGWVGEEKQAEVVEAAPVAPVEEVKEEPKKKKGKKSQSV